MLLAVPAVLHKVLVELLAVLVVQNMVIMALVVQLMVPVVLLLELGLWWLLRLRVLGWTAAYCGYPRGGSSWTSES